MKKYFLGAALLLGILLFSVPLYTHASILSTSQISAIVQILRVFGADQSVIDNVQAVLSGGSSVTTESRTSGGACPTGYILNNTVCKPRVMNLTASANPAFYLSDRIVDRHVWDDWKSYAPLVQKVSELTAGKTSDLEKAKAILNWVHASKTYGCPELASNPSADCTNSPANKFVGFPAIFTSDVGVCLDAAVISTAMLRAAGIAAMPRHIDFNHIVTVFYANGIWYSADATFSANRATAGAVQVENADQARNRFVDFIAGENEQSFGRNGAYCDNEFCMGMPFQTGRVLSNPGITTARVTFPSIALADYDSGRQVRCGLEVRGVTSSVLGLSFPDFRPGKVNEWQATNVQLNIGDNRPVGYLLFDAPVNDSIDVSKKAEYRFVCKRGFTWGATSDVPLAYKEVAPHPGDSVVITYNDLVRDASATDAEFVQVKNIVKSFTADLGISPSESPAPSQGLTVGVSPTSPTTPTTPTAPPSPAPTATPNSLPLVSTNAATNVTATSVALNGSVNSAGTVGTTGWFRGSATNPGTCNDTFGLRIPATGGTAFSPDYLRKAFSESVSGLTSGTTYYYCAIAQNATGKSYGSIVSFTAK